jgi:DNA polymerase-3 subunit alpha/error-prone DNA polymerase
VLASTWKTRAESGLAVRAGLHLLPGLGRPAAALIERERAHAGFRGVADFARRCRIPIRLLETLARAGALDALRPELHRHQLGWLAQTLAFAALHRHRAEEPGTQWLFAQPPNDDPPVPVLPTPAVITIAWERFQVLGFCPEAHPVRFFQRPDAWRADHLPELAAGTPITLTAWAITRKQVSSTTASGGREPMAFVTLEDDTGLIETVWFPAAYRAAGALLDRHLPVRIHGVVEEAFGVRTVTVERAEPVSRLPA